MKKRPNRFNLNPKIDEPMTKNILIAIKMAAFKNLSAHIKNAHGFRKDNRMVLKNVLVFCYVANTTNFMKHCFSSKNNIITQTDNAHLRQCQYGYRISNINVMHSANICMYNKFKPLNKAKVFKSS